MLTLEEALRDSPAPREILGSLTLLTVYHWGYDEETRFGQLVIPKMCLDEVSEIFNLLYHLEFPIEKIVPISEYNWCDDASMADNNTSAFNYRLINDGTGRLSKHSCKDWVAIDINPRTNPCYVDGSTLPSGASYNPKALGAITKDGKVVKVFTSHSWKCGINFENIFDPHHFEKKLSDF